MHYMYDEDMIGKKNPHNAITCHLEHSFEDTGCESNALIVCRFGVILCRFMESDLRLVISKWLVVLWYFRHRSKDQKEFEGLDA